ncbi:ac81-like protein [Alphabaculovirus altersperidaniae]|uniref:Ac81-like protein n=1 Tax=Spodoptera eridania nucleopolyhedrovirus TaxID=2315721 RepID=A0ABX6TRP7_9ABAC|nr:ac81-like protein [Spodoptera eridania nucleopolyhedrovirus]QNV47816.1 ac81-like protein [Spodoptera eridania nucleopolyhedrovirus]
MLTANSLNPHLARTPTTTTTAAAATTNLQTATTTPEQEHIKKQNRPTNCLALSQLNDKNLTTLSRVKFDADLLIHYVFDGISRSENTNVIRVCKVRVKKACGTLLAHYYAQIEISNGFTFEFHPGSQPRTFQHIHTDGNVILVFFLCDECCKKELRLFIDGENDFNVAFKNCESILCKRKSVQTVYITMAILILFANIIHFSWYFVLFIFVMIVLLYLNNNYMISNPQIVYCPHKRRDHKHHHHYHHGRQSLRKTDKLFS